VLMWGIKDKTSLAQHALDEGSLKGKKLEASKHKTGIQKRGGKESSQINSKTKSVAIFQKLINKKGKFHLSG